MHLNSLTRYNNAQKANHPSNSHDNQSYNQILNLRTTLLQMQYLFSSLNGKLSNQHSNQQNQHKDHLIQCHNIKQQYEEYRNNNFTKLLIVKLQQFLALEEQNNKRLTEQNLYLTDLREPMGTQIQCMEQYQLIPKLDKFLTYVQIKQQQMQQSLCKLYVGNKSMVDLEKMSKSIEMIQRKIDSFLQKNCESINIYNHGIAGLDEAKDQFKVYLKAVQQQVSQLSRQINYPLYSQDNARNTANLSGRQGAKWQLYQKHLKSKLVRQSQQIQKRIYNRKQNLLKFQ